MYVKVKIYETSLEALVDTGATCTILHPKLFTELAQNYNCSKQCQDNSYLKGADGRPIQTDGVIELDLMIGRYNYAHRVIIADVEVPMVIG